MIFAAGKKVVICGHLLSLLCLAGSKNKKTLRSLASFAVFFKKRVANRFFFAKWRVEIETGLRERARRF